LSLSAQVVAELVAAGLSGGALVAACRRIEAADGATVSFLRGATVQRNSSKSATVATVADATVAPGAGAGKAPLAMLRASISNSTTLSRTAARVGAAILDRFDPKTGRCAIGVAALSRVCGVHRTSVFRAITALCQAGLVDRVSYGGINHCNAYVPKFATVEGALQSQSCHPISDSNKTTSEIKGGSVRRKPRRSEPDRRQMHMALPIAGGLADAPAGFKPTPDAIRAKAVQRLWKEWHDRHRGRSLKPDPVAWEAAIQAEIRNPGTGLATHDRMVLGPLEQRRTGTGPPG